MKNCRKLKLLRRPGSLEEFFRFRDRAVEADPQVFEEFLAGRTDEVPKKRAFGRIKRLKTED